MFAAGVAVDQAALGCPQRRRACMDDVYVQVCRTSGVGGHTLLSKAAALSCLDSADLGGAAPRFVTQAASLVILATGAHLGAEL